VGIRLVLLRGIVDGISSSVHHFPRSQTAVMANSALPKHRSLLRAQLYRAPLPTSPHPHSPLPYIAFPVTKTLSWQTAPDLSHPVAAFLLQRYPLPSPPLTPEQKGLGVKRCPATTLLATTHRSPPAPLPHPLPL
jgi:hypothetical protein